MSSARADQDAPSKADIAKLNKFIKDTINQIDGMGKKRRQLKLLVRPRKMTAKLGLFSKNLYRGGKHSKHKHRPDDLSHLPNEIVHMIIRLLRTPDIVAMALTSKRYMAMIESTRKVPAKRPSISRAMRLAVLVRLHEWMPPGLKLCYSCIKFIPSMENSPWYGDEKIRTSKLANQNAMRCGPECNACHRRGEIEGAKANANAQRLTKMIREM